VTGRCGSRRQGRARQESLELRPMRRHRIGVDDSVEGFDRSAGRGVSHRQGHALVRRRPLSRIDPPQRGDEPRQISCQRAGVVEVADPRVLAVEPAVDRPMPRLALRGHPFAERDGNGDREERGKSGQPPVMPPAWQPVLGHPTRGPMTYRYLADRRAATVRQSKLDDPNRGP
jgi:hypothetical protein